MQVWTGTSGYSYSDWVGSFYPPGTRPGRMLSYYCRQFPLVELNFTFYRLPTANMLTRLAEQTPAEFQFLVKLPRTLSHDKDLTDLAAFRQAAFALAGQGERGRLLGLLCQLPQATHDRPEHRAWIERLAHELSGLRLAVEFRHRSWFNPEVPAWLGDHDIDLVSVDAPDLPGLYPRGLVRSTSTVYVRFHSRNARNWYRSDKERYDFDYTDELLSEWIDDLGRTAQDTDRVLLLFNNCARSQAAANAQRMQKLLSQARPEMAVVQPFVSPQAELRQGHLFE
jgi:uncharacterized protein YecE (DUF72 family)